MFVASIPFSTSMIGEYRDQHISVYVCWFNIPYELGIFNIKNHRFVNSDLDPRFIVSERMIAGLILYAIAIAT